MEFNKEILRWVLLIGSAPIWIPFLKALWEDFSSTLAEDGGIFGRTPTAKEREQILREKAQRPDVLVSEPWTRRGEQPGSARRAARSGDQISGARRRSGFR